MLRVSVPSSLSRAAGAARALAALASVCAAFSPATSQAQLLERPGPASPTSAPATSAAAVDAEVDALLAHLGSDDWPTRAAAQDRLAALAELAEPRLQRAARESDDAEVRTRCQAALRQIAENRLIGPTLITMRVHNVHPRIAFAEVARQAGVELKAQNPSLWSQPLPAVTLDVQREPFWDVVERIREQCGLDVGTWQAGLAIVQMGPRGGAGGGAAGKAPVLTHGPFRVRAARVSRSYAVDLASGGVAVNEFNVLLSFQAEPKLKVHRGDGTASVTLAEDENGLSLVPNDAAGAGAAGAAAGAAAAGPAAAIAARRAMLTDYNARGGSATWPVTARLEYPPHGAGKRIARLKGAATCSVVVRAETLDVPDILSVDNVSKEIGGTTVTVRSCRKVGTQYQLVLSLARADAAPAAARALRGPGQANIRLVDESGRDMTAQGTSTSMNNNRIEMTLRYAAAAPAAAAGAPSKLVWQVPTEVRDIQIPFEFTDLPLP